jgi:hypothetical protein
MAVRIDAELNRQSVGCIETGSAEIVPYIHDFRYGSGWVNKIEKVI